jgi:mRNA-degrading endonuclease RelE of RelBE toxin-antitoxin system
MNKFVVAHTAMGAIGALSPEDKKKVINALERIQADPTAVPTAYEGMEGDPIRVVRAGDFRIYYRFVPDEAAVLVLSIYRADRATVPAVGSEPKTQ